MKLYNQASHALRWDMGGHWYTCDPYGAIDVPDELLDATKARGLPLNVAPIAAEQKAAEAAARAMMAAEASDTIRLQERITLAEAAYATAQDELERERAQNGKLKGKAEALEAKLREQNDALKTAAADHAALEKTIDELSQKLAAAHSESKTKGKRG